MKVLGWAENLKGSKPLRWMEVQVGTKTQRQMQGFVDRYSTLK